MLKRRQFGRLLSMPLSGLPPRRLPAVLAVRSGVQWCAATGACLGILAAALGTWALLPANAVWLIAPMGASAVLVFAVPSSPLAQPWPVIVGNTGSALVGVVCASHIPEPALAAALAVGLAIVVMSLTHSLHPPGGATALLAVLMHAETPIFAVHPVAINSVLLVVAGVVFHRLGAHPYPHQPAPPGRPRRFSDADIDVALREHDALLDVSRADIETLLEHAETAAYRRTLGAVRCEQIMVRPVCQVKRNTPVSEAHRLMRQHRVKALPVTAGGGLVVGILTAWDVLEHLATRQPGRHAAVGALMSTPVVTARADRPVVELVRLIAGGANHHIPIVDQHQRLVGILTQSDLIRTLHQAVHPGPFDNAS